jgi:hypothetical protein
MNFSERQGIEPVRSILQVNSMNDALRNRLWNVLAMHCWQEPRFVDHRLERENVDLAGLLTVLWNEYFKKPVDEISLSGGQAVQVIRSYYFAAKWNKVYDILEFIVSHGPPRKSLIADTNNILEAELSAYRFVGGKIVPITTEQEMSAVERALVDTVSLFRNSREHLRQAISLLAQKPKPDYRNTIKESISAVEALCAAITSDPKATLGQALKVIDPQAELHGALRSAFEKLYGYTSDADGIRHALMEDTAPEQEDAVFMLVACSAFISYVIAKHARKTR